MLPLWPPLLNPDQDRPEPTKLKTENLRGTTVERYIPGLFQNSLSMNAGVPDLPYFKPNLEFKNNVY